MGTIAKMKEAADKNKKSLFDGDEDYEAQCEAGDQYALVDSATNFIGLKTVKTCENCHWNNGGFCCVMEKYNPQLIIPVGTSMKCGKWEKRDQ